MNRSDGDMHSVPRRAFRYSPSIDQLPSQFSGLHRRCKRGQRRERGETSPRSLWITNGSFLSNQLGNHELEARGGSLPPVAGSLLPAGDYDVPSRSCGQIADNAGLYVDPGSGL